MHRIIYTRYGDLRIVWVVTLIILALVTFIAGIVGGITWVNSTTCHNKGNQMGLESDFGFWTECMYLIDGQWVDADWIRLNDSGEVIAVESK